MDKIIDIELSNTEKLDRIKLSIRELHTRELDITIQMKTLEGASNYTPEIKQEFEDRLVEVSRGITNLLAFHKEIEDANSQ